MHYNLLLNFKSNINKIISGLIPGLVLIINIASAGEPIIIDQSHYSPVLGEVRNFRVFLPPGYYINKDKSYPVIYYYHGWSQRYFGSITSFQADQGEGNDGDNIANFVALNDVIVVKADGYNRRPADDYNLRPHNIGPVETHRQFPLYFPELVKHIDANYRTIADRGHRAISGLSMGGFMTFWISGKYPHLVSAVGNFCGSTEFIVGPIDFPVEYRHQELYNNYNGLNVRLNYGNNDFIRAYHKDMNKIWTQVMDNYEYVIYEAEHSTAGLGDMFTFLMESFNNPPEKPSKWHHFDVYPSFDVWGYHVESDRNIPGFTILENVTKQGFRSSSRTFVPDGVQLTHVNVSITTPPIYEKNHEYQIVDIIPEKNYSTMQTIQSDHEGKLKIRLNGDLHEIGISKKEEVANIAVASWKITNRDWATHNQETFLALKLLNKGTKPSGRLYVSAEAFKKSAEVTKGKLVTQNINPGETYALQEEFIFLVKEMVEIERLRISIKDENGTLWTEFIDIPIKEDNRTINDFIIADGKEFEVAAAGDDAISMFLGKGNGDGIANPGESIVILIKDNGRYHRALLYSTDSFINPAGIHLRHSDNWSSYDHVGASAKYSVPVIASNVPDGHIVKFASEYWLPDYPDHIIKRGVVQIKIEGKDKTPPVVQWVKLNGDNTIHVCLYDGGGIAAVRAKFSLTSIPDMALKPVEEFEIELFDNGEQGDRTGSDNIFGRRIQEKGFGLYKVQIEAEDAFGNRMVEEWEEVMVLH